MVLLRSILGQIFEKWLRRKINQFRASVLSSLSGELVLLSTPFTIIPTREKSLCDPLDVKKWVRNRLLTHLAKRDPGLARIEAGY